MNDKELIDQSAHFCAAFAIVALPQLLGLATIDPLAGAILGFFPGLMREISEESETVNLRVIGQALGSYRDLTFWTLGGFFGGHFL